MPARSVVITSVLVVALLLAVALAVRFGQALGVDRSVTIAPGLTLSTRLASTVAFIVEHHALDGTTTQLAWGVMANNRNHAEAGITLPTTGTITIRWGIGKLVGMNGGGGLTPMPTLAVMAGPAAPSISYALMDIPGDTSSLSGATSLQLGPSYTGRFEGKGLIITSSVPAAPAPPPPPPAGPEGTK